jgi:hypothetical protein
MSMSSSDAARALYRTTGDGPAAVALLQNALEHDGDGVESIGVLVTLGQIRRALASSHQDIEQCIDIFTHALTRIEERLTVMSSSNAADQQQQQQQQQQQLEEYYEQALNGLALLLHQEQRFDRLQQLLSSAGFRYRLSDAIICYPHHHHSSNHDAAYKQLLKEGSRYVRVLDNALPVPIVQHLRRAFSNTSAFWREHHYSTIPASGYFSYLHPLQPSDQPPATSSGQLVDSAGTQYQHCFNGFDQIIAHVHALVLGMFPKVAQARYAEWWAHCRPHSSGHQLHFDSDDEGRGGVRNPIVSTVIFLSTSNRIGGPTLVTNQAFVSRKLADRGWLAHPADNRIVMFDGSVLHGVIPGHGVPDQQLQHEGDGGDGRRITLMIAFWKDAIARPGNSPGANRLFPQTCPTSTSTTSTIATATSYSWQHLLAPLLPHQSFSYADAPSPQEAIPIGVSQIWQDVNIDENKRNLCNVAALRLLPAYHLCFQGF